MCSIISKFENFRISKCLRPGGSDKRFSVRVLGRGLVRERIKEEKMLRNVGEISNVKKTKVK